VSVLYRKEVGSPLRAIEKEAARARGVFVDMAVFDQETKQLLEQRLRNKFLVKGRVIIGGRVKWDVYAVNGRKDPVLIAGGFDWQEEAIAFARDRKMGRQSVSFGGIRGLFKSGSSGLSVPSRNIDLPGKTNVNIKPTKAGVLVG
tara:strand:+ start:129 stop:563 length:435 start_codon:yes stop_codon:yes gene_type:complete